MSIISIRYSFKQNAVPQNFKLFQSLFPDLRVGVTLYENIFSEEDLKKIESECFETELDSFNHKFLPMTAQMTQTNNKIRRTKFFFGYRYLWGKQLNEKYAKTSNFQKIY